MQILKLLTISVFFSIMNWDLNSFILNLNGFLYFFLFSASFTSTVLKSDLCTSFSMTQLIDKCLSWYIPMWDFSLAYFWFHSHWFNQNLPQLISNIQRSEKSMPFLVNNLQCSFLSEIQSDIRSRLPAEWKNEIYSNCVIYFSIFSNACAEPLHFIDSEFKSPLLFPTKLCITQIYIFIDSA